ncbi:MAG: ComF family protein [Gammaproteobacteria bacterium]|nr:ComF family protein [Gammaproteobacteria bacterium]
MPARCLLCLEPVSDGSEICPGCLRDLPWIRTCCRRCALPLPIDGLCGRCQRETPSYDMVRAPLIYRMPVDALLRGLKFHGRLDHVRTLAGLMTDHVRESGADMPDLLVPVPLHSRRLRERGFNQAAELAGCIGRGLGVRTDIRFCERIRSTAPQSDLNAAERRRNLRGAFRVVRPNPPSYVAIVDDVMTTGATAESLSRTLRRHGVERIEIWVCARTPD